LATQKAQAAAELQQIKARMAEAASMQAQMQSKLAPAREMRFFLEALLAKQGQLRVLSIQTMSPKVFSAPGSDRALLYRHGLQIEVSGEFHDLLAWLHSAENMPKQLLWDDLSLKRDDKSGLVLSVQVHTLSPDKEALEITP
jgi:MSHA biogenesis protein MshJ